VHGGGQALEEGPGVDQGGEDGQPGPGGAGVPAAGRAHQVRGWVVGGSVVDVGFQGCCASRTNSACACGVGFRLVLCLCLGWGGCKLGGRQEACAELHLLFTRASLRTPHLPTFPALLTLPIPNQPNPTSRVKDHGRAEALLIAAWGSGLTVQQPTRGSVGSSSGTSSSGTSSSGTSATTTSGTTSSGTTSISGGSGYGGTTALLWSPPRFTLMDGGGHDLSPSPHAAAGAGEAPLLIQEASGGAKCGKGGGKAPAEKGGAEKKPGTRAKPAKSKAVPAGAGAESEQADDTEEPSAAAGVVTSGRSRRTPTPAAAEAAAVAAKKAAAAAKKRAPSSPSSRRRAAKAAVDA